MRKFVVVFDPIPKPFWWRIFARKFTHCFLYTEIEGVAYRIENAYGGTAIVRDDSMEHIKNRMTTVTVTVPDEPLGRHRSVICTCAGFCATFIGLKGFIMTPDQLYRRLKRGRNIRG